MTDVLIHDEGTVVLFLPCTVAAHEWIDENVQFEPYQRLGRGIVVEHRYAHDLHQGMEDAGLSVGGLAR